MSLEYMCQKCNIRLDPLMSKEEADFYLKGGCPFCGLNQWVLVEGLYDQTFNDENPPSIIWFDKEGNEKND